MSARLEASEVAESLDPADVIRELGLNARKSGRSWRLSECPGCRERSPRGGVAIYKRGGRWRWTHHGHQCFGDMLELIAVVEQIDGEFHRLVARGAEIAGIAPVASGSDHAERRAQRQAEDAERRRREAEREAEEKAAAVARMPQIWESLPRRHDVGERYLAGRGLDPGELRACGDVVRYSTRGEVAVPLRDLETGAIAGIQYRWPSQRGKGLRSETGSRAEGAALHGRLTDLDPGGVDVAVLAEGLADTLAALLEFRGCAVYGAPGAGQLPAVAAAVARRVAEVDGWLMLPHDDDRTGIEGVLQADAMAERAGLKLMPPGSPIDGGKQVRLIDLGGHHDLADAFAAGWRHRWPS